MKITVPRQDLLDAVNKVKSIVSSKSALPILSHILFEADKSTLRLSATDLKVSIECTIDCAVHIPGTLTISSQRLSSILGELPDADINIELEDMSVVSLTCGKIHTKLFTMSADEFPPIRTFDDVTPIVFPQKVLKDIFRRTSFAICTDQARYNLTGLLIEMSGGKLTAVATDGRRMSMFMEEKIVPETVEAKIIIPGKMIHELERLLDSDSNVEVSITENQAGFAFDSIRLVTALIEGNFPNYEMVIPKKHDKEAIVDTGLLTEAVRRTRTMTSEKFNSVRLAINSGQLTLKVVTPEVGEYEEELPIDYDGENVEIAFNPDFLLDVLRQIDTEATTLLLKDPMSPGVLKPQNSELSDRYVNVVMPIRI